MAPVMPHPLTEEVDLVHMLDEFESLLPSVLADSAKP